MKTELVQKKRASLGLMQRLLQQQLQIIKLKELLTLCGFVVGAAALRAAMQGLPSVEPITFFAMLGGMLFGRVKGFMVGAGSLYISNFLVFGGQGPWTPVQALAFGVAGFLGGLVSRRRGLLEAVGYMLAATLIFEIIMNTFSGLFFGGNFLLAFYTGSLFMVVHLVSNLIFAPLLPYAAKKIALFGGFDEKGFVARSARVLRKLDGMAGKHTDTEEEP